MSEGRGRAKFFFPLKRAEFTDQRHKCWFYLKYIIVGEHFFPLKSFAHMAWAPFLLWANTLEEQVNSAPQFLESNLLK